MAGRPQGERIVAAAAREALRNLTQNPATAIAAGNSEQFTFYAAANSVDRVLGMFLNFPVPAGATSGSHKIYVSFASPTIDLLKGDTAYNNAMTLGGLAWSSVVPSVAAVPSDPAALALAIQGLIFDSMTPMVMTYVNSTNAAQAGTRNYRVWATERQVR